MPRLALFAAAAALVSLGGCSGNRPAPVYPSPRIPQTIPGEAPAPGPPGAATGTPAPDAQPTLDVATLPGPTREFRGAWIATVANIDWPSSEGLSTDRQQDELRGLLDRAVELGLNAVVLQVRPAADALYASELEPWSEFLTGREGRAPSPFYDPLTFAVDEAHARGLQLHAWVNPFRAGHTAARGPHGALHVSRTHPEWTRRYGDQLWLDPGEPGAVDHSLAVVLDVVARYDIDGIHLDDYFYPYPVGSTPFPDADSYRRAQGRGETLGRADWRRQNVDRFVERLYAEVRAAKPDVLVGISPFGIWRPGNPAGITGFDAYEGLYADARKWLQEGWLDYLAPQLYWSLDSRGQNFGRLLGWWADENTAGRHLWPGLYDSRTLPDVGTWRPAELVGQVEATRAQGEATGTVHFSFKALAEGRPLGAALAEVYAEPALVPPSPWLDSDAPRPPRIAVEERRSGREVTLAPAPGEAVRHWVVRTRRGGAWTWSLAPGTTLTVGLAEDAEAVAVSAVDRSGNESAATVVEVQDGGGP